MVCVEAMARAASAVMGLPIQAGLSTVVRFVVETMLVWIVLAFHMDKRRISFAAATMRSLALAATVFHSLAKCMTSAVSVVEGMPAWIVQVFRTAAHRCLLAAAMMPHRV